MPGDGLSQAGTAPTAAARTVEGQLRSFLAVWIEEDENAARSAGHGFAHHTLNADWTELDGRDNLRLSYDVRLVRAFSPDRVVRACAVKRTVMSAAAGTRDEEVILRALAEEYRDRPGFGAWDSTLTREEEVGSLTVTCTVCGDSLSIPDKNAAYLVPAPWESGHQHASRAQ